MPDCEHTDKLRMVIPNLGDLQIPCSHCSECGYRRCNHEITCCNGADWRLVLVPNHLSDATIRAAPYLMSALLGLNRGPSDDWCICPDSFIPLDSGDHHENCAAARLAIAKAKGKTQ